MKTEPSTARLERLLKLAETSSPKPREPHLAPIERVERGSRLVLSFAQQRLWFLEQLGNLGGSYHVDRRLRLVGELDRAALVRALDRLVARHETLRTTFAVVDGEPEHRGHEGMAKFDLSLTLGEKDGRIAGVLLYAAALLDRATAERYAAYFRRVVEQMVADDGGVRVEDLALLSDGERARVVDEWNATAAPYPDGLCVHQLFERRVVRSPDAVAVVFEGEPLSYAELNARANRLAHHLRAMGVAPEEAGRGTCARRTGRVRCGRAGQGSTSETTDGRADHGT